MRTGSRRDSEVFYAVPGFTRGLMSRDERCIVDVDVSVFRFETYGYDHGRSEDGGNSSSAGLALHNAKRQSRKGQSGV